MAVTRIFAMMLCVFWVAALNGCSHVDVTGKWKGTMHGAKVDEFTHKKSVYYLVLKEDGTGYFKDVDMDQVFKLTWTQSFADLAFVLDEQPADLNSTRNKYARLHEDGKNLRLVWEDIRHPVPHSGIPEGALLPEISFEMVLMPKKAEPEPVADN